MTDQTLSHRLRAQGVIAEDPQMRAIFQNALSLAQIDATVLICGESGTGKDQIAQFIHRNGPRHNAPFIHINCGAIPQELFESELFGYESGTFTGGLRSGQRGLLEAAQGGTLFLDEIGEMDLMNQSKLLDFLQSKQIMRLGSKERKNLDVRIISATNRDLKARIRSGTFREDLYYRICVVNLDVPPLRERPADIAALAERFINTFAPEAQRAFTPEALRYLQAQRWPGNVRELQSLVERVLICETEQEITGELLAAYQQLSPISPPVVSDQHTVAAKLPLKTAVARFEREYISDAIAETDTLADAAKRLGIDLDTLNRKKRQYGIYKRWNKGHDHM